MNYHDYRDILAEHYRYRYEKNPSYSLKAFSRDLGLKIHISDVFNRRYGISAKTAETIASNLDLNEATRKRFILLVQSEHAKSKLMRNRAQNELRQALYNDYYELQENDFSILDKWYYLAIKELAQKKDFQLDSSWIASNLGIKEEEAQEAIDLLKEVGIFAMSDDGSFEFNPNVENVKVTSSKSVRNFHRDHLKKAIEALDDIDPSRRDFTTGHFIVNPKNITLIRERIANFKKSLYREFSPSKQEIEHNNCELYCFSGQFFSLESQR